MSSSSPLKNDGSAFVISILVLFVLSVLGMALMLTTTTEKDIAINYRWGEQAFFNADAALEYGKNVLGSYLLNDGNFARVLPPPRDDVTVPSDAAPWGAALPVGDPDACDITMPGCREYQYYADRCPQGGGGPCVRVYIGKVLRRPDGTLAQYDFRLPNPGVAGDLDGDGAPDVEGTVTLWVRRPIVGTKDYGAADFDNPGGIHDRVILTAEGTAPGAAGTGARPVSLRRLEMTVRQPGSGIEGDQHSNVTQGSGRDRRRLDYDQVQTSGFGTP